MSKYTLFLFVLAFTFNAAFAQKNHNDYDTDHTVKTKQSEIEKYFKQKQNAPNPRAGDSIDMVPIRVHVVEDSTGSTADSSLIHSNIDALNSSFANINIEFSLCDTIHYFLDEALFVLDSTAESDLLTDTYNDPYTVDLFIVGNIDHRSAAGYASLGWRNGGGYIVIQDHSFTDKVLIHEAGHYFNLLHTHDTDHGVELVDGSNCDTTGDLICDTPADPGLSGNVNSQCEYTGTATDPNGDPYQPDVANHMSYALNSCRNEFTPGQYDRMRYYYENEVEPGFKCTTTPDFLVNMYLNSTYITPGATDSVQLTIRNRSGTAYNGPLTYTLQLVSQNGDSTLMKSETLDRNFGVDSRISFYTQFPVPSGISEGEYQLMARIDADQAVTEFDETNNVDSSSISVEAYDFAAEINLQSYSLSKQTENHVNMIIKNNTGITYSGPVSYSLKLTDPDHNSTTIASDSIHHSFQANERDTVALSFNIPAGKSNGMYTFQASVDTANAIPESDLANNTVTQEAGLFDSTLAELKGDFRGNADHLMGTHFNLQGRISNFGNDSAGTFRFKLLISTDTIPDTSDVVFQTYSISGLAAGKSQIVSQNIPVPQHTDSSYYILIITDIFDDVNEIKENNNLEYVAVPNTETDQNNDMPDYVISDPHFYFKDDSLLSTYEQPYLQFSITNNNSNFTSTNSLSGIYISTDTTLSDDDHFIKESFSTVPQITIPAELESGDYYIIIEADHRNFVDETNENNNTTAMPVYINSTPMADLTITNPVFSKQIVDYNEELTFDATVENIGMDTSNYWRVMIHVSREENSFTDLNDNLDQRLESLNDASFQLDEIPENESASFSYTGSFDSTYEKGFYHVAACVYVYQDNERTDNNCVILDEPLQLGKDITHTNARLVNDAEHIRLYPNPANNHINIAGLENVHKVIIRTPEGKVVKNAAGKSINVAGLKAGLYLAEIHGHKKIAYKKILIK